MLMDYSDEYIYSSFILQVIDYKKVFLFDLVAGLNASIFCIHVYMIHKCMHTKCIYKYILLQIVKNIRFRIILI